MFTLSNRNARKRYEICTKLTIKTLDDVIDAVLIFLLLTLKIFYTFFIALVVDFEQVNSLDSALFFKNFRMVSTKYEEIFGIVAPFITKESKFERKWNFLGTAVTKETIVLFSWQL